MKKRNGAGQGGAEDYRWDVAEDGLAGTIGYHYEDVRDGLAGYNWEGVRVSFKPFNEFKPCACKCGAVVYRHASTDGQKVFCYTCGRAVRAGEVSLGVSFEDLINEGNARAQACEVEAVPAGQLAFKGRGWGKRGLEGKVEALASLPVCQLDNEAVTYELVQRAGRFLPADKIHVEETVNVELWHRSRVKWDVEAGKPKDLEVYYHNKAVRLPVLAHEVGHLETLPALGDLSFYCSSPVNQYHAEVVASRWALGFLRSKGLNGRAYAEAVELLQGCLDNYYRELGVPVRYELDDSIPTKFERGQKLTVTNKKRGV